MLATPHDSSRRIPTHLADGSRCGASHCEEEDVLLGLLALVLVLRELRFVAKRGAVAAQRFHDFGTALHAGGACVPRVKRDEPSIVTI